MEFLFKNTKINYELFNNGKDLIVFLHGWGANISLMKPLANKIKEDFSFLFIDFPPFGNSQQPCEAWNLDNYVNLTQQTIEKVCLENNFSSVSLISHSFGGRVAIKLATKMKIKNLVLIASAGLKPKFSIKVKFSVLRYKILKRLGSEKAKNMGSNDYRQLSPIMKQTFNNIIQENLKPFCKKIDSKTLIVFGNKDSQTPLYMGKRLNRAIKNSKLVTIKNADHFAYLKHLDFVGNLISFFLISSWKLFLYFNFKLYN